jgi:hypothetical protein
MPLPAMSLQFLQTRLPVLVQQRRQASELVDEINHRLMPDKTVLIRKIQKQTLHATHLQDVERGKALRNCEPVVQTAMDD